MGSGYILKCPKCRYYKQLFLGMGMRYPLVCDELLCKIKKGEFGELAQNAANQSANIALYAPKRLFRCPECKNIEQQYVLCLCEPEKSFGQHSSYVRDWELSRRYQVVYSQKNICKKCKIPMKQIKRPKEIDCPRCGTKLEVTDLFWD